MKNRIKKEKLTGSQHNRLVLNPKPIAKPKRDGAKPLQGPTQTLNDSELRYRSLFENMLNGLAYCKMLFENDRPVDFIYLDVNSAFESLTGLTNAVGKKVTELIPGIRETDPGLFEIYGRVALTGKPEKFETYVEALKMWFSISVYSPEKEYFVAVFDVITERKRVEEAMLASEARYRGLFEDSPISIWEEDFSAVKQRLNTLMEEGITNFDEYLTSHPEVVTELTALIKVKNINKATMKMFGTDHKEDLLKNLSEIFNIEQIQDFKNEFINIAEGKTQFSWEGRNKTIDGRVIDIALNWSAAPGYEGSLSKVIVSMLDITERRHAEVALRESEARFRGLFEDSPVALWEEDFSAIIPRLNALREEGITDFREYFNLHPEATDECAALIKFVDVNKAAIKLMGANNKDELFKVLPDRLKKQRKQEFQKELINIAEGKTHFGWEGNNITLDGRQIDIALNWSAAPGYEDSLSKVIVSMIDITERNRSAEQLVNERNLLRTLIDNLPDAVYVKDIEGRFMLKNLLDARQMGASTSDETIGKTDFDYYSPELAAQYQADDQAVFQSGQPIINHEEPIVDATGRSGWVQTTKVPLRDSQGNVIGLVGIGHNITERKLAEKRIQRQLEHLASLRDIDMVIISSFDLHHSLTMILKQVTKELAVDAADVLLLNSTNLFLEYSAGVGFRTKAAEKAVVRLGQNYAGRIALDRQLVQIPNLKDQPDDFLLKTVLAGEDFRSYFGVPLIIKGAVKGVLEIYHRGPLQPDQEWLDFLNIVAGQAALAIDNAHLFDTLQRSNIDLTLAYDATIEGWSHAMDLRDKETEGHSLRVTDITIELAGLFGIKDEDLINIRRGTLLHDIGKIGVPDAILLKPAALTEEEWVIMRMHPTLAFEMLSPINYLKSSIDIPYCHHEKWDGTGYPRGLKGEQIPLPARIFAIVDVWDALTSDRPYRKAWSIEKTLEYLKSQAGKHFDPQILRVCLEAGLFDHKHAK